MLQNYKESCYRIVTFLLSFFSGASGIKKGSHLWEPFFIDFRELDSLKSSSLLHDELADGVGALARDADEVGALGHAGQVNLE